MAALEGTEMNVVTLLVATFILIFVISDLFELGG